ncbi:Neuronal pentraxin-1 [Nibea albiflora]|uniref:Neuronal pentraxin-1 n=1 Tax=Nibea albiflora TaxID=240163 RepID=A0ACB7F7W6_NIBAL|nr:Neuronal pentraxin-1 [Nibea albiflora]
MEIMRNSQPLHLLLAPIVFSLLSLHLCPTSANAGSEYDFGAHPRFICTPIPMDADPACFPTVNPGVGAAGPSGPGHQSAPPAGWWGASEEAKATILHLRESLVQQKETILDQRETIRELTAKLTLCEGLGRGAAPHDEHHGTASHSHHAGVAGHHMYTDNGHYGNQQGHHGNGNLIPDSPHYASAGGQRSDAGHSGSNNQGKDKHVTPGDITSSPEQMERMLHALKERLDNLQKRNTSIAYSSSLKELLQRKISALEQQLHRSSKKKSKSPDAFQISFPMRTNYMYGRVKRTLPQEIFALTLCLWIKAGVGPSLGTPFSYSAPGQANELVLIEWGSNPMELLIDDKAITLPLSLNDGKWHHVCVTWSTRDGQWEAYQDGVQRGSGINLSPWHPIKPGGVFILGQEQDALGGRFDATQSFVGEMSDLHMWSHVLTAGEISSLASCGSHLRGDVISWSETEVELHGGVSRHPFDPCH